MKKVAKHILFVIIALLVVLAGLLTAALTSWVQTHVVNSVLDQLETQLGIPAKVDEVSFQLPCQVRLRGIYIPDQQGDTLIYVDRLSARMRLRPLRHQQIVLTHACADNVFLNAYTLPGGQTNYRFVLDAIPHDEESKPLSQTIVARDVQLRHVRLRYDQWHATLSTRMALDQLSAHALEARLISLQADLRNADQPQLSPFAVTGAQLTLRACDTLLTLPRCRVELPNSALDLSGVTLSHIQRDSTSGKLRQVDILGDADLSLYLADIATLVPFCADIDHSIHLQTNIRGSMDSLCLPSVLLQYDHDNILDGMVELETPLADPHPHLHVHCNRFATSAAQIERIATDMHHPLSLPVELHRLGQIVFDGCLSGSTQHLHLDGNLRTQLGTITSCAHVYPDSLFRHLTYHGDIETHQFRLAEMLHNDELGPLTTILTSAGEIQLGDTVSAIGEADIMLRDVAYHQQVFDTIRLHAHFEPGLYSALLSVHDSLIDIALDLHHNEQISTPQTKGYLRVNRLMPASLTDAPAAQEYALAGVLRIDLKGLDFQSIAHSSSPLAALDPIQGDIDLDTLRIRNGEDSIMMPHLMMKVRSDHHYADKAITIYSDLLQADISGHFSYADLPRAALYQAARYLPSAFNEEQLREIRTYQTSPDRTFYCDAHCDHIRSLQRVLRLSSVIRNNPELRINYREYGDGFFSGRLSIPGLRLGKMPVSNVELDFQNPNPDQLEVNFSGHPWLEDNHGNVAYINLQTQHVAKDDQLSSTLHFHQLEGDSVIIPNGHRGLIRATTTLCHEDGLQNIDVHLHPDTFVVRDTVYHMHNGHVRYSRAREQLTIEHISVSSESQSLLVNGSASHHAHKSNTDSIMITLQQIEASYLLPFVLPEHTLRVDGRLSGWANIYDVFTRPTFAADVHIDEAQLNRSPLGDAHALVTLDTLTHNVLIHGEVYNKRPSDTFGHKSHRVAKVLGEVIPADSWSLDIWPDSIPLGFISHWTNSFMDDMRGYGSGHVRVFGRKSKTWVTAEVRADSAQFRLPITGCSYRFTDSVYMDSTSIRFNDIVAQDAYGHDIPLRAVVQHDCFDNFRFDVHCQPQGALVFDLPYFDGDFLSGHVFATGTATVVGNEDYIRIGAQATTRPNSWFRLSVDQTSSAYESNFIRFHSANTSEKNDTGDSDDTDVLMLRRDRINRQSSDSRIELDLDIDVNRDLDFQLMLGARNEDMIRGRGEGPLHLLYDTKTSDVQLTGTYSIERGTIGITIANMIHRNFDIAAGSSIRWSRQAEDPVLDVTANYRSTPNIRDLLGDEVAQLSTSRTNIPVSTSLHMTGLLSNPVSQFSLQLPSSDEALQTQVNAVINSDEMLMRQVVYLLVFGRFYRPEYLATTMPTGVNETYSILSSTITGQINAWLGKLTNVFSMGVNIRSEGVGQESSQEYEAQFQLQPVDRLTINGNVGYRYNDISNRPFFGDLDAEIQIVGGLSAKAYTHTVDKYSLRQATTIQGVGLLWRHDFNWPTLDELRERREQHKQQAAERKEKREAKRDAKKAQRQAEAEKSQRQTEVEKKQHLTEETH